MRTISPKIFAKLDFFTAMPQNLFCTENILPGKYFEHF